MFLSTIDIAGSYNGSQNMSKLCRALF